MDTKTVLENNISDLNMALNLAETSSNETLIKYVRERLEMIKKNQGVYQFISVDTVVNSYAIDLELFYNVSSIIRDIDSKDYFKSRIIQIIKNFPHLSERSSLTSLL